MTLNSQQLTATPPAIHYLPLLLLVISICMKLGGTGSMDPPENRTAGLVWFPGWVHETNGWFPVSIFRNQPLVSDSQFHGGNYPPGLSSPLEAMAPQGKKQYIFHLSNNILHGQICNFFPSLFFFLLLSIDRWILLISTNIRKTEPMKLWTPSEDQERYFCTRAQPRIYYGCSISVVDRELYTKYMAKFNHSIGFHTRFLTHFIFRSWSHIPRPWISMHTFWNSFIIFLNVASQMQQFQPW